MDDMVVRTGETGVGAMRKLLAVTVLLWPGTLGAQVVQFYHLDAIGNVRAVTNQAGQIVERHDYLPFGEECTAGPCASNPGLTGGQPKHFTGKERDTETGLDYFGARYYRANLGRFTSVDPTVTMKENIVDPQRWNRYAYGRNNPLRFVDPNGRDWIEYSGEQVTWYGGSTGDRSQPSGSYPASSGLPGHQTPSEQRTKDAGPVPEGDYSINLRPDPNRVAKADSRTGELVGSPSGGIEQVPEEFTTQSGATYTYGSHGTGGGWGNTRAQLEPAANTQTSGRSGFYLHDSEKGYTHGCVETKSEVLKRLTEYRKAHPGETRFGVRVQYTDPTTRGKTTPDGN